MAPRKDPIKEILKNDDPDCECNTAYFRALLQNKPPETISHDDLSLFEDARTNDVVEYMVKHNLLKAFKFYCKHEDMATNDDGMDPDELKSNLLVLAMEEGTEEMVRFLKDELKWTLLDN